MARDFIATNIPDSPFIGIHLRNGPDFVSKIPSETHVSLTTIIKIPEVEI